MCHIQSKKDISSFQKSWEKKRAPAPAIAPLEFSVSLSFRHPTRSELSAASRSIRSCVVKWADLQTEDELLQVVLKLKHFIRVSEKTMHFQLLAHTFCHCAGSRYCCELRLNVLSYRRTEKRTPWARMPWSFDFFAIYFNYLNTVSLNTVSVGWF